MVRMFGKIAKFFRKSAGRQSEASAAAPLTAPEQKPLERPKFAVPGMEISVATDEAEQEAVAVATEDLSGTIKVPFSAILPLLPKELQGKGSAGGHYKLPKAVALEQLSRGTVKIPFGELRRGAPNGLFAGGSTQDAKLVDLPLREILKHFKPASFARRPGAHRITVPDEVTDLFGAKGERLTEVRVIDKSELKPAAPATRGTGESPAPAVESPATPIRIAAPNLAPQMQAQTSAPAPATIPFPKTSTPPTPKLPAQAPIAAPPSMGAVPKLPQAPKPTAPTLPPNAIKFPTAPAQMPRPSQPPAAAVTDGASGGLSVSIGTVNQKWPAAIRALVQQLGVTDLEIPHSLIETALKLGRIDFQWQQVVTWFRPAPDRDLSQEHAGTVLELPLSVVAPLYLQQNKYKAKKSSVPGDIPDLFSNKGEKLEQSMPVADTEVEEEEEVPAPIPPPRPAPRPAPVAPPRAVAPAAPQPAPAPAPAPVFAPAAVPAYSPQPTRAENLSQLFREPNKKNWTPNEIVHKTITMPGIIGALIALQDGLLVAGSMPPPWKTETIAAFIPQIFGRLTQYTKELQMGEVTTVSFGVESGTLQIFNAGIIYFGALGQPGAALPVEDLTLIATELSRHTK
jgi:predicted regulator of Ras-like GTPase activity (Roadblock/LC7/MglB family)